MAGRCRRSAVRRRCRIIPPKSQHARQSVESRLRARWAKALRSRDFWLLAGTFFVCGFTTNGLVGTHMIALCHDHGMDAVAAGGLLAIMGLFDLVGTTASGWLTDRFDPRKLLFAYYGLRGLSLIYLPFANFTFFGLSLFAVFYGLDWIATVPPTLAIANKAFGTSKAPMLFGWIAASHQIGAAIGRLLCRRLAHRHRVLSGLLCHRRLCRGGRRLPGPDDRHEEQPSSALGGSLEPGKNLPGAF